MGSGGDVPETDLKLFMKVVQDQFRMLNARLDNIESPSKSKTRGGQKSEEEKESDSEGSSVLRGRRDVSSRDNNLGSIKMRIPSF